MSVEDFNNGLIMGLSLQGTMFVDRKSGGVSGADGSPMKGIVTGIIINAQVGILNKGFMGVVTEVIPYEDYI